MRFLELNGINYIKSFCNKNILTRQSVIVSFKCSRLLPVSTLLQELALDYNLQKWYI